MAAIPNPPKFPQVVPLPAWKNVARPPADGQLNLTERIARLSDLTDIVDTGTFAFWNEDNFGRMLHPARSDYPADARSFWARSCRHILLDPTETRVWVLEADVEIEPAETDWPLAIPIEIIRANHLSDSDSTETHHARAALAGKSVISTSKAGKVPAPGESSVSPDSTPDTSPGSTPGTTPSIPPSTATKAVPDTVATPARRKRARRVIAWSLLEYAGEPELKPATLFGIHSLSDFLCRYLVLPFVRVYNILEEAFRPNRALVKEGHQEMAAALMPAISLYTRPRAAPSPPESGEAENEEAEKLRQIHYPGFLYLAILAVHPNFQKSLGLGSRLLRRCVNEAEETNRALGLISAVGTGRYYTAKGFQRVGHISRDVKDSPFGDVRGGGFWFKHDHLNRADNVDNTDSRAE